MLMSIIKNNLDKNAASSTGIFVYKVLQALK